MVVCAKCKKEMTCTKTGRPLVWRSNHVYSGDEFGCKTCGALVVYSGDSQKSYHLEKALQVLEEQGPINMDKEE